MSSNQAHNPFFAELLARTRPLYTNRRIPLDNDALVVFTCGADASTVRSGRTQLLAYAERYFKHGTLFRAEDAFPILKRSTKHDYLSIEERLADYSDCVVLINESAGTLAELGAFASNNKVVNKLLIVNDILHVGHKSFINLGPLAKADKKSKFKKTIHTDMSTISKTFDAILDRITDVALRRRRLSVDFTTPSSWRSSKGKHRLLLVQDLINLFSPITELELEAVMKALFTAKYVPFHIELGLLCATKHIYQEDGCFIVSRRSVTHSYDIPHSDWLSLRKRILDFYRQYDPARLPILTRRAAKSS